MKKNNGYTLIEILIALVVFAIVMTMITAALFNTYNTQLALKNQQANLFVLQKAMMIVERDIEQTMKKSRANASILQFNPSQAQPTLHFTTIVYSSLPIETPFVQLQQVAYFVENQQFIRQTDNIKQVLLSQVASVQWRFYDDQQRTFTLWPPVNQLANTIPRGVAMKISFNGGAQLERTFLLPSYQSRYGVQNEKE